VLAVYDLAQNYSSNLKIPHSDNESTQGNDHQKHYFSGIGPTKINTDQKYQKGTMTVKTGRRSALFFYCINKYYILNE